MDTGSRPGRYVNQIVGINKLCANEFIELGCVTEDAGEHEKTFGHSFRNQSTKPTPEQKDLQEQSYTITPKLQYIEQIVWNELKTEFYKIEKQGYDISDCLGCLLFPGGGIRGHFYGDLGSFINKLQNESRHYSSILSHVSSIVAFSYFVNNKLCRSGNQKAVYSSNLCFSYYDILKRGFLLRVVEKELVKQETQLNL